MRYISLCLLLFISHTCFGQQAGNTRDIPKLPLTANKIVYTGTIQTDTAVSKAQLFHNAEEWYQHNFETADNTLTIDNIDSGTLSGTGIIHINKKDHKADPGDLFFTVDVTVAKGTITYHVYDIYSLSKDGRLYYSDMYNEALYPEQKPKWPAAYRKEMLNAMNEKVTTMIAKMLSDINRK